MDLWKESLDSDLHPTFQNISFTKDTPPHITKRKLQRTTQFEPNINTIEEDQEDDNQFDNSRTSVQNLYTNIASRHIGTKPSKQSEPDIQLGKGQLQESIQGPQYFHGYSKPLQDPSADF